MAATRGAATSPAESKAVFEREVGLGASAITIVAIGGKVVLSGHIGSWRERDMAQRIAWSTPGVTEVLDQITVD